MKKKRVQQHEKRGERGEEGKRKGKSSDEDWRGDKDMECARSVTGSERETGVIEAFLVEPERLREGPKCQRER